MVNENKEIFLDVRTPAEFASEHIEGSVNIPMEDILRNIRKIASELSKTNKQIILICRSGARAQAIQEYLAREGVLNTKVMEGGLLQNYFNYKIVRGR